MSGQRLVVSGQWPAAGATAGLPVGPEPTLVVQGLNHQKGRDVLTTEPEVRRALDLALADLVADADQSRGKESDGTSGVRIPNVARDAQDGTGPERIGFHPVDSMGFVRPVRFQPPVRPVDRDLIRTDSTSDALLDDIAATVGMAGRLTVSTDSIAPPESPQEPGNGLAKLAATLILAGSWGHRARFQDFTSRQAGRQRERRESK